MHRTALVFAALAALAAGLAAAAPARAAGLLEPVDGSRPPLAITDHRVTVTLNNGFAITEVDQVFHNPHDVDLDAVYTFPLPRQATLSELSLWLDGEEIVGEVVEKKRGRQIAAEERAAGRETALAEQRSYIAFDVAVSPVRARSDTRVRLVYLQPIDLDTGVGRYVYPLDEGGIDTEMQSFWNRTERVDGSFRFDATLRSAYPLDAVRVAGHEDARVQQLEDGTWTVHLEQTEGASLAEDVVLYYRLVEDVPARVDLFAHRAGEERGTFMVVVTPGADLQPIQEGTDWNIVLDISGSMSNKLSTAASGLSQALRRLRPEDRFRVVVFDERARELVGWQPVTPDRVATAIRKIETLGPGGGTNLYAGLETALDELAADRTAAVVLVSDGGANVGSREHRAFVDLLARRDVRVFAFVMGQGANTPLLERIATESGGFSMPVSNRDDLYGRLLEAQSKLSHEALHGVEIELDGARVTDLTPRHSRSVYRGEQIVLFGRYAEPGFATLRLRARISGDPRSWETRVELPALDERFPELERLWAYARTRDLQRQIDDERADPDELRPAIVDLATEYSFVTEHTSMIVVRPAQFERYGIERRNARRVERERAARTGRASAPVIAPRADQNAPMFDRPAPAFGGGALGPAAFVGLAALGGLGHLLRRRGRR